MRNVTGEPGRRDGEVAKWGIATTTQRSVKEKLVSALNEERLLHSSFTEPKIDPCAPCEDPPKEKL